MRKSVIGFICILFLGAALHGCGSQGGKNLPEGAGVRASQPEGTKGKAGQTEYNPIPLVQLIGMSDLAVEGHVAAVDEDTFDFVITEFLEGSRGPATIRVRKFVPPAFLKAGTNPYDPSQSLVLFLRKSTRTNIPWTIIGIGGEGEMPVVDGFVYFVGMRLEGMDYGIYTLKGVQRNSQRFDVEKFKEAVKEYGTCFTWDLQEKVENNRAMDHWAPTQHCAASYLIAFKNKSPMHDYLVRETVLKIPQKAGH